MPEQFSRSPHSERNSTASRLTGSSTKSRGVRRYFKQNGQPNGWWPWGVLPLLGLLLLFLWGLLKIAPDIQSRTRASVASLLNDAGYQGLDVSVDGQIVRVSGSAAAADLNRIRSIARGATCDSFVAKDLVCPTRVVVEIDETASLRPHDFSFVRTAEHVVLRGDVPDSATRAKFVVAAREKFGTVIDSLKVTNEGALADFEWASEKAWRLLGDIQSGRIDWLNGLLSVRGRVDADRVDSIRTSIKTGEFQERIGAVQLFTADDVDACNEQFRSAMTRSTITFDPGQATISSSSLALLRSLASVANSCPGNIRIEGHTDDVGGAASNQQLSQERAQAVLDALTRLGVESSRLAAVGFGETRPVGSNNSRAGRARNRRIEIKVADFN